VVKRLLLMIAVVKCVAAEPKIQIEELQFIQCAHACRALVCADAYCTTCHECYSSVFRLYVVLAFILMRAKMSINA
jgi:hypothetical protein